MPPVQNGMEVEVNRFMQGVLFALAGASLWGFSGGIAQFLFSNYETSSLFLTAVRMPCAALLLFTLVQWKRPGAIRKMLADRQTLRALFVFGMAGFFLSQATYLFTVDYTNAGTATVLQQSSCVLIMLYSCVRSRRGPRPFELAALACAMIATFLIATGGDPSQLNLPLAGLLWGLANAITVAIYIIQPVDMMRTYGSMPVICCGMATGSMLAIPVFVLANLIGPMLGINPGWYSMPSLDGEGWLMLALFVLVGTFAAYALYMHGVSVVGSVVGSLLGCAEPVSASLFSVLWLGSAYTWADWTGLVLMLATVVLITLPSKNPTDGSR